MSAYERFRKDIDDGQYDDQDQFKKNTEDLRRETEAAIAGGAMTQEESRLLLFRYIDRLLRQLMRRGSQEVHPARASQRMRTHARYDR